MQGDVLLRQEVEHTGVEVAFAKDMDVARRLDGNHARSLVRVKAQGVLVALEGAAGKDVHGFFIGLARVLEDAPRPSALALVFSQRVYDRVSTGNFCKREQGLGGCHNQVGRNQKSFTTLEPTLSSVSVAKSS